MRASRPKKGNRRRKRDRTPRPELVRSSYEPSLATVVEIIAFREITLGKPAGDIAKSIDILRDFSAHADDPALARAAGFALSGTVVRTKPVSALSALFYELRDLAFAQGALVSSGMLVRGGVTFGNVVAMPECVFGPAVVEARELESRFAVFPRIVVSPSLLDAAWDEPFESFHSAEEEARDWVAPLLRRGDDGVWFVDYGREVEDFMDHEHQYAKWLFDHRRLIVGLGGGLHANWLAQYHNGIVHDLPARWFKKVGVSAAELRVNVDEIATLNDLPSPVR